MDVDAGSGLLCMEAVRVSFEDDCIYTTECESVENGALWKWSSVGLWGKSFFVVTLRSIKHTRTCLCARVTIFIHFWKIDFVHTL